LRQNTRDKSNRSIAHVDPRCGRQKRADLEAALTSRALSRRGAIIGTAITPDIRHPKKATMNSRPGGNTSTARAPGWIRRFRAGAEGHSKRLVKWICKKGLAPSGKSPAYAHRRKHQPAAQKVRGLFRFAVTQPSRCDPVFEKEIDTTGKSPAYIHRRKNLAERQLSPRREIGRGLFHF
jgi:hypothetical protein